MDGKPLPHFARQRRTVAATLAVHRSWRRAIGITLAMLTVITLFPAVSQAGCGVRPQDEIWFVDSRPAFRQCSVAAALPLSVQRLDASGVWKRSDVASLAVGAADKDTVIWVHGNRIERGESWEHGWLFYRGLSRAADDRPLRLVIWSWPADQVRGVLNDVRYKAALTEPAGYHLARVLQQFPRNASLGLVGFSYGARVITTALQLMAGQQVGGYQLPATSTVGPWNTRAVFWAAALSDDWLLPGHYHGEALTRLQYLTLLNNSCDRALKRYRLVDPCCKPEALGYCGLPYVPGLYTLQIAQYDVACEIGKVHTDCTYLTSSHIIARTWEGLTHEVILPIAQRASSAPGQSSTVAASSSQGKISARNLGK